MIKKIVLVVVMLSISTNLWAVKGPQDVSAGPHNLGSLGTYQGKATNEDEVCIFCHTPHGSTPLTPLWNRALTSDGTGFTHYTSTTLSTFTSDVTIANRTVNTESLLCMSCHDGTVAMNNIINNSNRTGAAPNDPPAMFDTSFGFGVSPVIGDPDGTPTIQLGKNLTDDHPISFSYADAYDDTTGNPSFTKLRSVVEAESAGLRFFGGTSRMECSTCHDPHVSYDATSTPAGDPDYSPFLITPNVGSALCLGCHKK